MPGFANGPRFRAPRAGDALSGRKTDARSGEPPFRTEIARTFRQGVLARPEGFEPSTCGLEVRRSIRLSYGRKKPSHRSTVASARRARSGGMRPVSPASRRFARLSGTVPAAKAAITATRDVSNERFGQTEGRGLPRPEREREVARFRKTVRPAVGMRACRLSRKKLRTVGRRRPGRVRARNRGFRRGRAFSGTMRNHGMRRRRKWRDGSRASLR